MTAHGTHQSPSRTDPLPCALCNPRCSEFFCCISCVLGAVGARPADSFVDSIGVNVHLGYSNTVYSEFPRIRTALDELGVRYIRDGVGQNRPDVYSRLRTLAEDNIKADIVVGDPLQRWGVGSLDQQLDMIEHEFPGAVASLEGPNEYDIQGELRTGLPTCAATSVTSGRRADDLASPRCRSSARRWSIAKVTNLTGRHLDLDCTRETLILTPAASSPTATPTSKTSWRWRLRTLGRNLFRRPRLDTRMLSITPPPDTGRRPSGQAGSTFLIFLDYFRRGISRTFLLMS